MAHAGALAQMHHGTLIRCNGFATGVTRRTRILAEKARRLR
jgi:hypothetical protein